jgi:hypothetical protein
MGFVSSGMYFKLLGRKQQRIPSDRSTARSWREDESLS